ncbi:MAG: immunity 42 family protein [Clostridiales bacterium]|nr:immunity 42 family protein [Clostridiales bacterium]
MIIGNPYQFSIFVKIIKEWNIDESSFHNGVLIFCVDGELFPQQVLTATLSYEVPSLKEKLMDIAIDTKLFEMEKENAFIDMYNTTFPKWGPDWDNEGDINNDYRYFLSPTVLSDFGCQVYAVSNGKQIRVMAAKLEYIIEGSTHALNGLEISETFITYDYLNKIIQELDIELLKC